MLKKFLQWYGNLFPWFMILMLLVGVTGLYGLFTGRLARPNIASVLWMTFVALSFSSYLSYLISESWRREERRKEKENG